MDTRVCKKLPGYLIGLVICAALVGCFDYQHTESPKERQEKAMAMWKERCKKSGEFIHKKAVNVEGIYLMKVRPNNINFDDQFKMDDPYGRDLGGEGYIESFLRGFFHRDGRKKMPYRPKDPPRLGYLYVEAVDPADGKRYRYTGKLEEPWKTDKSYSRGYIRFVSDKTLANGPLPRYGVTYDDISTREEREYWIAGSSLKVIDLQTKEVMAERIGYMVDWAQGSRAGNREPWLFAADNACPSFHRIPNPAVKVPSTNAQLLQSLDFVEKALIPLE
jgi:hypothetical protein